MIKILWGNKKKNLISAVRTGVCSYERLRSWNRNAIFKALSRKRVFRKNYSHSALTKKTVQLKDWYVMGHLATKDSKL